MASSLSTDTKDALARDIPDAAHCREALLCGLAYYGSGERPVFVTRRNAVVRLLRTLLGSDSHTPAIEKVAGTRLYQTPSYRIALPQRLQDEPRKPLHRCDRVMEARAAFLACGSLSAGARGYHLEFVPAGERRAARLEWMLRAVAEPPKQMTRKARRVIYYKDFDAIVGLLTVIGAHAAVLHLEDVHALKETKNRIHRLVNTEAANLERSAGAAAAQAATIEFLASAYGLQNLSVPLREIATLRLSHPDESLAELGRRASPPIGKQTASGRIGALVRLARRLHRGKEA